MNFIKVSIIVPVYNADKYLNRCMESLVNQTLHDIEIILVDDASTDNSSLLCDEWAKRDGRIIVIHKPLNEGLGEARNTGMEHISGEYYTFVDSDDFVEADTYKVAYEKAVSFNVDICYYQYRRFPGKSKENKFNGKDQIFKGRKDIEYFQLEMLGPLPQERIDCKYSMSVCMGIFRTEIVKKAGLHFISEREVASEDMIFHMLLLPYVNGVCVLPNVFYNYYVNPNSITTSYSEEKRNRLLHLLKLERSILDKQFPWEKYKHHYYTEQIRILRVLMKYESRSNYKLKKKIKVIRNILSLDMFTELFSEKNNLEYRLFIRILLYLMKKKWAYLILLAYSFDKNK